MTNLLAVLVLLTTNVVATNHYHANAGTYGANYGMAYAHGYVYAYGGMSDAGGDSNSDGHGGGGSHAAGVAAAAGSGSDGSGASGYWSEASVVDSFTTMCPEPTVFTYKDKAYTATKSGETLTISDCPCSVTMVFICFFSSFSLSHSSPIPLFLRFKQQKNADFCISFFLSLFFPG